MTRPLTVSDSAVVSATPDAIYAQVADPSQMPRGQLFHDFQRRNIATTLKRLKADFDA